MDESAAPPLAPEVIAAIVARHGRRTGDVLGVLEEAQRLHPQNYLPEATYDAIAQRLGVARSQIMSVLTFYAFFNRQPQGRHTLAICRGTACHTRGSRQLLETLKSDAGVPGAADDSAAACTTADGRLTIRTVACFGQCALAPVAAFDERIHGHVSALALRQLLASLDAADNPGAGEKENER